MLRLLYILCLLHSVAACFSYTVMRLLFNIVAAFQCCGCMVCSVAAAWCTVWRLHGVQCCGCMVCSVAAAWCAALRLHGVQCCGCMVYGTVLRLHGVRCCGYMVCTVQSLSPIFSLSCFHSAEAAAVFVVVYANTRSVYLMLLLLI